MKLEVGMYVRTTYGIGKIKNAYIVYDDGGSLWHLAYMTDNPKIEVSIYTKERSWQIFGEVQKDHSIKYESIENNLDLINEIYKQELDEVVCYVPCNNNYPRNAELFDNHKFLKSSFDIIDLIEVGDYVNGKLIHSIQRTNDNAKLLEYGNGNHIKIIKEVLTHEQYEANCYKVVE